MLRSVMVVVIGIALPASLFAADPKLELFSSKAGNYSIKMPGKPKEQANESETKAGKITVNIAACEIGDTAACFASYTDFPAEIVQALPAAKHVENCRDGNLKGNSKLLSDEVISLGAEKYPGREVKILMKDEKNIYRARIFMVKNRLYQIVFIGPEEVVKGKMADEFLDSFKLAK